MSSAWVSNMGHAPPVADPRGAAVAALASLPDLDQAVAGLHRLATAWPDWDEPLVQAGARLRAAGRLDEAARCYNTALARDPDRHSTLLALGTLHIQCGRPADSLPLLRRCSAGAPRDPQARHALGLALLTLDQAELAHDELSHAHALDPSDALCAVHLADAAQAVHAAGAVLALFTRARARDPGNAALLTGMAATLVHLDRRAEALEALEAATLLDPAQTVAAALYADMLARSTRQEEAEAALGRALTLDPANTSLAMARSVVLLRLHRPTEAVELLHTLLARGVDPVGPLSNLTTALIALGRQDEAMDAARRAIVASPRHPAPYRALCNAMPYWQGATGAGLLAAAQDCASRQPRLGLPPCANAPVPGRRLRLGLVSGTLRTHPVGWLTAAAFEQLDPAAFELVCLSGQPAEDVFGRRFAAMAAEWHDTAALDDGQLALRARALGIDIAIDLGGYGDFGRMAAMAHRLAPVQVKWVGMQNHSSGLAEMDWFVTDRWATPPALASLYAERLMVLPDGYVCYSPPPDAPPVAPAPCLQRGHVGFGCFNNLSKITPAVIALWSRILAALPDTTLLLKTHQFNDPAVCAAMHAAFADHGIATARIILGGSAPHRDVLAHYAEIDIVLDPFPYSGGLTTCEALWMGVPTLTMPGDSFASRHSASHLSNVGLPDWIVADQDAYVAAAVQRATNQPALAALRADLRARTAASPLCDAPRFAAGLAAALRGAWRDWCATAAGSTIIPTAIPATPPPIAAAGRRAVQHSL